MRDMAIGTMLLEQPPEVVKLAKEQAKKRVKFGRMELISDLWDDDRQSLIFLDGEEVGFIAGRVEDVSTGISREMRVYAYEVELDWSDRPSVVEVGPAGARAALTEAKNRARNAVAAYLWSRGWRPKFTGKTIKLTPTVQSVFETDVYEPALDPEAFGLGRERHDYRLLMQLVSPDGSKLLAPQSEITRERLFSLITDLSNTYDDAVEYGKSIDPAFDRRAASALATLARKLAG